MKKTLKKASFAMALGMLTTAVSAECSKFECENVRVVAIYQQANGDALVQLTGKPWRLGCKPTRYVYVNLPLATDHFDNLYAHLAAYQIMEQPITVRLATAAKDCAVESFSAVTQ